MATLFDRTGALFFKGPLNRAPTQNNNVFTLNIQNDTAQAQTFNWIFIRCKGVTSYTATLDGTGIGTFTVPSEYPIPDAEPAIAPVSIIRHGWQNVHAELSTAQTGSSLVLTFIGTNIEVKEVFILELVYELEQWTAFLQVKFNDTEITEYLTGEKICLSVTQDNILRWKTYLQHECTPDTVSAQALTEWLKTNNPFIFAPNAKLYPWRTYFAVSLDTQVSVPYLTNVIEVGQSISFSITEQKQPAPEKVSTFSSIVDPPDSKSLLFFNDCIHLRRTGVIDDNNYETETTDTTLILNIENTVGNATQVTHLWMRGTEIATIALQIRVSNTWTTQETITPTWETQDGIAYSLTKLTNAVATDEIRLVMTSSGGTYSVSEVMLLNWAGAITTVLENQLTYADRTATIEKRADGTIYRIRRLGAQRIKRNRNITAYFEFDNTFPEERFLDWVSFNPNFVLSASPIETYPAVFETNEYVPQYLTTLIQSGIRLDFNVLER